MARQITGLAPTTELEAVNRMLASIGEAPILQAELESPSRPDTEMAVNFITTTTRQVLSMGWRFNTEFGFAVQSDDTYSWTGSDGSTATLNIFERPSDLLAFELTQTPKQNNLSVGLRPPRDYTAAEGTLVFYDRNKNRDGFEDDDLEGDGDLYIYGVFAIDFEDMPETGREYVAALAAVRFQARLMGSQTLDRFTKDELAAAWRNFKDEQGQIEEYNIFNNTDTMKHLGLHRRIRQGYRLDTRDSPRP